MLDTPCVESKTLGQIVGAQVFLKFENLQFTASFKERGALNKLLTIDKAQRARGVEAASSGNHAQGVAWAARQLGIAGRSSMSKKELARALEKHGG